LFPERRKKLLSSGVTKIFVSIDAATHETYNNQRKNDYFDVVSKNVKSLVAERNALGQQFPVIRVSFLKNQINIHEADLFYQQWKDVVDVVSFQTMNEVPGEETGLTIDSVEPPKPCSFPSKQLVVDSEGDILPCCKLYGKELVIGNIDSMSITEAWNHPKMISLRKAHLDNSWQSIDTCRKCLTNQ
jgi:radical SAM protein with 4Fe4S-binding SPASM domain